MGEPAVDQCDLSDDLRGLLIAAVADALDCPPEAVDELRRADDGPWDSVGHIQVVLAVEEVLGYPLDEDDLPAITSLADVLAAAQRAGQRLRP